MITKRTWKIITCIADLVVLVLFVVQVVSKSTFHQQVIDYSPYHSSVDVVVCTCFLFKIFITMSNTIHNRDFQCFAQLFMQ